jgi:predicted anti-sigma-YlaC factor YlaD
MEEIVQTVVEAAVEGTAINPTGLMGTLVDSYKISLKKGMLMYEILTAFWAIIVGFGIVFIVVGKCKSLGV